MYIYGVHSSYIERRAALSRMVDQNVYIKLFVHSNKNRDFAVQFQNVSSIYKVVIENSRLLFIIRNGVHGNKEHFY